MAAEEIGFAELREMVKRHWKSILGLAVFFGLAAFVAVSTLTPVVYQATAQLLVFPPAETGGIGYPIQLYRSFLESDGVLKKTTEELVNEGRLPAGSTLVLGRDLSSRVETANANQAVGSAISLTAKSTSPETAAEIANAWVEVFVEESRTLPWSTAAQAETLLEQQLAPTRDELETLEGERYRLLDEFQKRQEEIVRRWDRQIVAFQTAAERTLADYQAETRDLMEQNVVKHFPEPAATESAEAMTEEESLFRANLLEIVSVRAELAKTPRVLTLEKTANDEELTSMILRDEDISAYLDRKLISQEANVLYDQLSVKALELENDLKHTAGSRLPEVAKALLELEKIQVERAGGWAALARENSIELRDLLRQKSFAVQTLSRERSSAISKLDRGIKQLKDLESRLSAGFNEAVFTDLLNGVSRVRAAAPAVPRQVAVPRRRSIKVALATLMGAVLGLAISLFRSSPKD